MSTVPMPIPAAPSLLGAHFTAQFFVSDPHANELGLTASAGVECIVR